MIYKRPLLKGKQLNFVNDTHRFVCCEASTKSGKTVGAIVWDFEQALKGKEGDNVWWVAPVFSQTEIAYSRLKRFISDRTFFESNESKMKLTLKSNGVNIWFKSADHPDSLYGDDVIAVVMDEASRCKENAYTAVRTTLSATKGKGRYIGNIRGIDNWFYKLSRKAESGILTNWGYHKMTSLDSIESGIFDEAELQEAKDTLAPEIFNELYYCIPFDDRGKPFFWGFDINKNICKNYEIKKELPIYISFDFNVNPICATVSQHDESFICTFKEFRIANSNIYELCERIATEINLNEFDIFVNGDSSGQSRSALTQNLNYYQIICNELMIPKQNFKLFSQNPSINNTRTLSNSLFIKHSDCKVAECCKYLIEDLRFMQSTEDGKIAEKTGSMTHLGDTIRYYHWANFNKFIKNYT